MSARDWRDRAVCRDEDPELFFPVGDTGHALAQSEQAKAVCYRCPVMESCLEWALDTRQPAGVWGGYNEAERRNLQRRTGRGQGGPRQLAPCGSQAAYRRHLRKEEDVCAPCREANRLAQQGKAAKHNQLIKASA